MSMFGVRDGMIAAGKIAPVGSPTTIAAPSTAEPTTTETTATTATTTEQTAAPIAGASGDANPPAVKTDATATAPPADDYADMPFNRHPRFQQLLAKQKDADARTAAAEADALAARTSAAELTERLAAIERQVTPPPPAKVEVNLPAVDPATVVSADAVTKAEAWIQQYKANVAQSRKPFADGIDARIESGEITLSEGRVLLARADDNAAHDLQGYERDLELIRAKHQISEHEQSTRLSALDTALEPLFTAYPHASRDVVKVGVQAGWDPEATAKWSHEQNAPLIAQAVDAAKAEAVAESAAREAELNKELTRLKRLAGNLAAAPSAIKPGNGDAGTEEKPKNSITSIFGMKDRILQQKAAGVGR